MAMDGTESVLKQMSKYDFKSSIDVTMVFEDSDDDDQIPDIIIEEENEFCNYKNTTTKRRRSKDVQYDVELNVIKKEKLDAKANSLVLDKNICDYVESGPCITGTNKSKSDNRNKTGKQTKKKKTPGSINETRPVASNKQNLSTKGIKDSLKPQKSQMCDTYLDESLNTLSEHILVIMQAYNNMRKIKGLKNVEKLDVERAIKAFYLVKFHYFHLSYSTVLSIILPQENNKEFIADVLAKILALANNKLFNNRGTIPHVEPFFKELVLWVKQEKTRLETVPLLRGDNVIMRQLLEQKPKVPPMVNLNLKSASPPNSSCLFVTGPASREIRISTIPETFSKVNNLEMSYSHSNNVQNTCISQNKDSQPFSNVNNGVMNGNFSQYQISLNLPPQYNQTVNIPGQVHSSNQIQGLPPSYHDVVITQNSLQTPNQIHGMVPSHHNIENTQNSVQSLHSPSQYKMNSPQQPKNYIFHNNNMYYNTSPVQNENVTNGFTLTTCTPVISNVQSLNTNTQPKSGKCCMCGKHTVLNFLLKCNFHSYCSLLCQELNADYHRSICK